MNLTIKQLAESAGGNTTPRMVRHYHQVGLLPEPVRSPSNYRLYNEQDLNLLKQIVALKQQGFQLSHIRKLLATSAQEETTQNLMAQLGQQYQYVIQQIAQLRQTATALESLLGRDHLCENLQEDVIAQLQLWQKPSDPESTEAIEKVLSGLDSAVDSHPEVFSESLTKLLPDLSNHSEIAKDLLGKMVLMSGDVSLVNFVVLSDGALASGREALLKGCLVISDIPLVNAVIDHTRLKHLGCEVQTLIDDSHISSVVEAEDKFWQDSHLTKKLEKLPPGCIIVIGYAPSVLLSVCEAISQGKISPALVIGLPIGFSHAPAAKRRLQQSGIEYITVEGNFAGGGLAAVALNAIADSLLEKPHCHCHSKKPGG